MFPYSGRKIPKGAMEDFFVWHCHTDLQFFLRWPTQLLPKEIQSLWSISPLQPSTISCTAMGAFCS